MALGAQNFKRAAWVLLSLLVALLALVYGVLMVYGIPQNAAGMAAKGICSAAFVAGRPVQSLFAEDVLPASPVLGAIRISIDERTHSVTATFAGLVSRRAVLVSQRGCVLELEPDASAKAYQPAVDGSKPWPEGDAALAPKAWGPGANAVKLQQVVDAAFVGAGNPSAANARGLAVVHQGRLLLLRDAPGFAPGTGLHGWSMTKTITGMLTYKLSVDAGLALDAPVVDAFPAGREPDWVAAWRRDARKTIKVAVGEPLDLSRFRGREIDQQIVAEATELLMDEITVLLAGLRGEQPPAERWDPVKHQQSETGRF